jgi:8-oxo-dGTP pyrophosphatase MutT (NUDIX family)
VLFVSEPPAVITVQDVRAALAVRDTAILPLGRRAGKGRKPAAVLCALFDEDGQAQVVLTRRSERLRSHKGQVAFPGGRLETGELPLEAALREAREEVGLSPEGIEVLGSLSTVTTASSEDPVHPFVVALPGRPALRPQPSEVARVFTVPLVDFVAAGAHRCEVWDAPGRGRRLVHFFDVAGETVWGATARILVELIQLVVAGEPANSDGDGSR